MRIVTQVFSVFAILATALPVIQSAQWWIRIFDYPRLQIAVLCLLALALQFYYFRFRSLFSKVIAGLLGVSLVAQMILIMKYTPLYPVQAKGVSRNAVGSTFRIMQSNVEMSNREAEAFLELVSTYTPDLLLVNEPDQWWVRQLAPLDSLYPYHLKEPQGNTYGMVLYSMFPLEDAEVHFLVDPDIPSMQATVVMPSGTFDLYCVHPEPPRPGTPTYERDTELLLVGETIKQAGKPALVVGDLNDVAWSYTSELFQRNSGLLDPREGRGFYNTYNVFVPMFRYPLDHFFYSDHFGLVDLQKLPSIGSDHFPMLIELHLNPQEDHAEHQPRTRGDEEQEVQEKIQEGREKSDP